MNGVNVKNIMDKLDGVDVSSFINIEEAKDYLNDLPLIKDIELLVGDIVKNIRAFAAKIKAIVSKVLSFLDLVNLFDNDIMKKVMDFIMNSITATLGVFGISASAKESLRSMLMDTCGIFNSSLLRSNPAMNIIDAFSLSSLLAALICSGDKNAILKLYSMLPVNEMFNGDKAKRDEVFGNAVVNYMNTKPNGGISAISAIPNNLMSVIGNAPNATKAMLNYIDGDTETKIDSSAYARVADKLGMLGDKGYTNSDNFIRDAIKTNNISSMAKLGSLSDASGYANDSSIAGPMNAMKMIALF